MLSPNARIRLTTSINELMIGLDIQSVSNFSELTFKGTCSSNKHIYTGIKDYVGES